jgi:phosphatidylglycerophosphatase A
VQSVILFIARGFGAGLVPRAPGTVGSLVGFAWFALLLGLGSLQLYVAGCFVGVVVSIWICGKAETILKLHDPSSIVLDEIIAIPICFISWMTLENARAGMLPTPQFFFSHHWVSCLLVFAAFRFFDIRKPPPVYQAQSLAGGLGVTMDDVLAAGYVNAVSAILFYTLGKPSP